MGWGGRENLWGGWGEVNTPTTMLID